MNVPARDDRVIVGAVGVDDDGAFLDVRCGDRSIRVGDTLRRDHSGTPIEITVERIEIYGREFPVLDAGLTARLWFRPCDVANQISDGVLLVIVRRTP